MNDVQNLRKVSLNFFFIFKTVARVIRRNIEFAMITVVTGKTQENREDFVCLLCLHLCIMVVPSLGT